MPIRARATTLFTRSRWAVLMLVAASSCGSDSSNPSYANDDRLRLEHVQMLGTHNSYHVAGQPLTLPTLGYTLPTLEEQLDLGVCQFELDVHWNGGDGLAVLHVPLVDVGTHCARFEECLSVLEQWSAEHPGHQPLLIFVEPKDDVGPPQLVGRDEAVEAEILSVWPRVVLRLRLGALPRCLCREVPHARGAHIISTDYPVAVHGSDYFFDIADGTPSRCNALTAPAFCRPEDIENLPR